MLGATGSVGRNALDVISRFPRRFRATALCAGTNARALAALARAFRPDVVCLSGGNGADLRKELPRGTRLPALKEPISWHKFAPETFDLGREPLPLADEISMGIYNAERCLVDAFRLRRLEGPELGNEALRRWLTRRGSQPARLLELAANFPKATTPLRHSLEVLL